MPTGRCWPISDRRYRPEAVCRDRPLLGG